MNQFPQNFIEQFRGTGRVITDEELQFLRNEANHNTLCWAIYEAITR